MSIYKVVFGKHKSLGEGLREGTFVYVSVRETKISFFHLKHHLRLLL